jgi:hypothetical protein
MFAWKNYVYGLNMILWTKGFLIVRWCAVKHLKRYKSAYFCQNYWWKFRYNNKRTDRCLISRCEQQVKDLRCFLGFFETPSTNQVSCLALFKIYSCDVDWNCVLVVVMAWQTAVCRVLDCAAKLVDMSGQPYLFVVWNSVVESAVQKITSVREVLIILRSLHEVHEENA